jgi:hypothetical protein
MSREICTKQVSVFLENKAGRLSDVCDLLGRSGINVRALCIADTSDFGILRLIVNDPGRAVELLRSDGHSVGETDVLAIQIADQPGGLAHVLNTLRPYNINVEYMYAFVTPLEGKAVVIFRVVDEMLDKTIQAMADAGISVVDPDRVYSM